MSIFSLTYVSSASGIYSRDIYRGIALRSRGFNSTHDISGMLLVFNETIIQFLEGPEVDVRMLYHKIEKDDRHKGPMVISTRELAAREFPDWSMGFKDCVEADDPDFIFALNLANLTQNFPNPVSDVTGALLSSYKRSSGLITA